MMDLGLRILREEMRVVDVRGVFEWALEMLIGRAVVGIEWCISEGFKP
jgi:hypothetical protein